jgi:hypothetical protein
VAAVVAAIHFRLRHVEQAVVGVYIIYTEVPFACRYVYGAIEILQIHEPAILTIAEHVAEVVVAQIESIIIVLDSPLVTIDNIVERVAQRIDEVEVYLVYIFILTIAQSQLISHLVGEVESFFTNSAVAHACPACVAHHGYHRKQRQKK